MTPAPADLSRVLRRHGYEPNMVLPEAMRRRMAADLGIPPSELESHIQAQQEAPKEPPVEVIDKSLPKTTRVLHACGAIGKYLNDEFAEADKARFTELLGVQRKAAMQYLKDTRAEFVEINSHSAPEPHEIDGTEAFAVPEEPDVAPLTTACTQHPTHTATRCEACVIEATVKTRTETAAQYEAQLNRAIKTMGERAAANRELADRNMALALKLETAEKALGAEKEAATLLRVKTNTLQAISDEKRRWVEVVTDAHTVLDNAGVKEGVTVAERVAELVRQRDEATTANENLMRENAALKDGHSAGDLSEIATTLHLPGDATLSRIIDAIHLLQDVATNDEEQKAAAYAETVKRRLELMKTMSTAFNNPNSDRSAFALFPRPKPELTDEERDFAISLLGDAGCRDYPVNTRAAVLQLAADMAALAASR